MRSNKIFVANDIEASGHRLGVHNMLSIGACVITRPPEIAPGEDRRPITPVSFDEAVSRGLVFYAEIQPASLEYDMEAIRIGASQLECLEEMRKYDSRYDPTHKDFDPKLVLEYMQAACERPEKALERFLKWISKVSEGKDVEGVTDTVFFDSGYLNLLFGQNTKGLSPYKWTGLDLDSLYKGYTKNPDAILKELNIPDNRAKPHRADHDAVFLANIARVLFYDKLGW